MLAGEQDILIPVSLSRELHEGVAGVGVGHHPRRPRLPVGAPGRVQRGLPRVHQAARKGLDHGLDADFPARSPASLERGQLGLFGVIMPGLAQVAPAFNLFFTTGVMVALAGASAPLIFLISMVGMIATASSLAQFSGVYPSAGSFITYITRAIGTRVATAVGVITIVGYIIAFGGIYIFVGSYIVQNVFGNAARLGPDRHRHDRLRRPGGRAGDRRAEVRRPDHRRAVRVRGRAAARPERDDPGQGREQRPVGAAVPLAERRGSKDVLVAFSLAVLAFGGFEAAAPLAEETRNPRRTVPLAVLGAVVVSGIIYVLGSYALVTAFGVGHAGTLAADANPFHTAAKAFLPFVAPLITWIFLSSVTSSYVAANTQTSRVIFAGGRGGLWPRALGSVLPRFRTPAVAAIAFVAPSIAIGVHLAGVHRPGHRGRAC